MYVGDREGKLSACTGEFHLPRSANIGNNVQFVQRGFGTVISGYSTIEDDAVIMHHVKLGRLNNDPDHAPYIKKGAYFGVYSIILGNVTIGENAVIGAGSLDIEDNHIIPHLIRTGPKINGVVSCVRLNANYCSFNLRVD